MTMENLGNLSSVTTLQYNVGILSWGLGKPYGSGYPYF